MATSHQVRRGRCRRTALAVCLSFSTVGFCSCASTRESLVQKLFRRDASKTAVVDATETAAEKDRQRKSESTQLEETAPPAIELASHSEPEPARVLPDSRFVDDSDADRLVAPWIDQARHADSQNNKIVTADFTAAEPRVPLRHAHYQPGPDRSTVTPVSAFDEEFEDEYLFDGGDRAAPVHYEGLDRVGLDTEDTVAEYSDHLGQDHYKPSNRVAVYAPRFGAVRTISSPESGISMEKVAGATETTRGSGLQNLSASTQHAKSDAIDQMRMRSRASGVDADALHIDLAQRTSSTSHTKLTNAFEDMRFLNTGQFLQTEAARLAYGIQAAALWSQDQSPIIIAKNDLSQVLESIFRPSEIVGFEDMRRPGDLRIIKLADKKMAQPGEIIEFSIRFDNLGDRELTDIRLIDNLTPRLEYVDGSATSDLDGELIVEDNEEGSLILKFLVAEPLPGQEGGVFTFKTRVR